MYHKSKRANAICSLPKQCVATLMGGFELVGEMHRKGEQHLPPSWPLLASPSGREAQSPGGTRHAGMKRVRKEATG